MKAQSTDLLTESWLNPLKVDPKCIGSVLQDYSDLSG